MKITDDMWPFPADKPWIVWCHHGHGWMPFVFSGWDAAEQFAKVQRGLAHVLVTRREYFYAAEP